MKRLISVICLCAVFFCINLCPVLQADELNSNSLTLYYTYEGKSFEGLVIDTFYVAEPVDNGFETVGAFANYPISLSGITSQQEWKDVATTLEGYIVADSLSADYRGITASDGKVSFSSVKNGLYFTMYTLTGIDAQSRVFESFFTVVPSVGEEGEYKGDVVAYPKSELSFEDKDKLTFKVLKEWKESGNKNNRPDNITFDIIKDGEVWQSHTLSAENNWRYEWITEDTDSRWQVVERNVPKGYTVSVTLRDNTFVITNSYGPHTPNTPPANPPQTGDSFVMWPYALAMLGSGGLFVLLSVLTRRERES